MTVLFSLLGGLALAQEPNARPRASLSVQALEIVSLERGHIGTMVAPGVSVLFPVSDQWNVIGVVSPFVGVDLTAVGGVLVASAQRNIWRQGPWHASVGPSTTVSRVSRREDNVWRPQTNLSAGVGLSLGKRGTVGQLGLDLSTTPEFDWALGLVPRVGISAAL
ncbi:MAG: hypothetical protein AAGA48_22790 [Myxococcota bacterium]